MIDNNDRIIHLILNNVLKPQRRIILGMLFVYIFKILLITICGILEYLKTNSFAFSSVAIEFFLIYAVVIGCCFAKMGRIHRLINNPRLIDPNVNYYNTEYVSFIFADILEWGYIITYLKNFNIESLSESRIALMIFIICILNVTLIITKIVLYSIIKFCNNRIAVYCYQCVGGMYYIENKIHDVGITDLENIKIITYEETTTEYDQSQCSICLDEFNPTDQIHQYKCKHIFHSACSKEWLQMRASCPYCNSNVTIDQINNNQNI